MYGINDVKAIISKIAKAVTEKKDYLGELDGNAGDGDLGFSMESAFGAIELTAKEYAGTNIGELLMKSAINCNKAAPSTMGTLLSSGVMALAKAAKNKGELSDAEIVAFPRIFADAIATAGKAKLGDKTILDALYPMADTVEKAAEEGSTLRGAFIKGAVTAEDSASNTQGMTAKSGRAKWVGKRAAEFMDAGAALCGIIAKAMIE